MIHISKEEMKEFLEQIGHEIKCDNFEAKGSRKYLQNGTSEFVEMGKMRYSIEDAFKFELLERLKKL